MKVLLTGAAGRLGSVTCQALVDAGHEVRGVDRRYNKDLPIRIDVADLRDRNAPYALLQGVDAVVHLANHPHAGAGDAQTVFNENITMNFNLFEAAHQMGIAKLVFASTVQVIAGDRGTDESAPSQLPYLPLDSAVPANPRNYYAQSKHFSELLLEGYARRGLTATAVRFPAIIRPEYLPRLRAPSHKTLMRTVFDDAFMWLAVSDAAQFIVAILAAPLQGFHIYLPAAPTPATDMPVSEIIERFLPGVPLRKPINELHSLVDISAITRDTGWTPRVTLEEIAPVASSAR